MVTSNVVELAAFRKDPHLVFPTLDGGITVMPIELIDAWIKGEVAFDPADQVLLRSIIKDWKVRSLGLE